MKVSKQDFLDNILYESESVQHKILALESVKAQQAEDREYLSLDADLVKLFDEAAALEIASDEKYIELSKLCQKKLENM